MKSMYQTRKEISTTLILFFCAMLYKLATDFAYCKILIQDVDTYKYDINWFKYILGVFWCVVLFWGIRHEKKRASTFMLFVVYAMQIIPITTIFSCANESYIFYNCICCSFLLCEISVGWLYRDKWKFKAELLSSLGMKVLLCSSLMLVLYIIKKNGPPSLIALNIFNVYTLRGSGSFIISRYFNYLLTWMMAGIIPFMLAKKIVDKSYIMSIFFVAYVGLIYLYTGHKTYLFCIPVVIICTFWAQRKNCYKEMFLAATLGFSILVFTLCITSFNEDGILYKVYSLFGRRLMMVSANNKFVYHDFFSNNPYMGFGGIFPRWLIDIPNYYENIPYPYLISEIYYGKPDMYSNTGFMAEGYMRFGHLGTFMIMLLFAWLLKLMDNFQVRVGYAFAVGAFVYPVIMLNDAHLIGEVLFGVWSILVVLLIFYENYRFPLMRYIFQRKYYQK